MLDLSNAQVSNWYSSTFHNRYLLESILKPVVQMERMSYWHNFIKKGELLLFCLLPALWKLIRIEKEFKPPRDKTNKMTYATSEDSDQPGHPPSLIRVFAVHSVGSWGPNVSSFLHMDSEDWSDWVDAQVYPSLRWAHSFKREHSDDWSNCGWAG